MVTTACVSCEHAWQGGEVSKKAMRSALQAAKAATEQILTAQANLAGYQASAKPVKPPQGYTGCDPAAEASIMTLAVPLVRNILSDRNADMSRVQRLDALKQAKEQVVEELTKQGVYRFQVGLFNTVLLQVGFNTVDKTYTFTLYLKPATL